MSEGTRLFSQYTARSCPSFYLLNYGFGALVRDAFLVFVTDIGYELYRIFAERVSYLPSVRGFGRMWCGCLGIIFYRFGGADAGHVLFPIITRGNLHHICLRFDWWAGQCPQEITKTRSREFRYFMAALVILIGAHIASRTNSI